MFYCPHCGASARIRTSKAANDTGTIRYKYYQCNNIECGATFSTMESVHKMISVPPPSGERDEQIPHEHFPATHRGRLQLILEL
ncbi:ogr/Delta-like zinc finger family protein [Escherichia coli]|uniref:ogr/Delta-like zinc finger family protein n=1 Tax=Escherichia coli TaxID=562 RepID=UPI001D44636A|nr:ogr/Delta-like zinc finger family protein [Escherichia coli]MBZ8738239.1 ogr/Delta-like zinc finger family protein [Escherichia coli]MBZ8769197.1 ogr/Delta-like zinc finger family protein [Escherichia coli]MBZ8777621.1 ogr/Delta-like zinc finger family protein [Escherichia coli]MBZ8785165.1 ogr/Delta-like zinc finger family protein [Escherichia coli]MBZ8806174.1 ogr/Delta-like zinc finger family protein [Escherichia coli]